MSSSFYRSSQAYLRLATPLILGNLLEILIPTTDTLMVGHLGKQYLAAAELANSLTIVVFLLLIGISHGLVPRVAALVANKQYQDATAWFKNSLLLNAVLGTMLCLMMYQLAPLLNRFDQDPEVVQLAIPYFQIVVISLLPDMVSITLMRYLEAVAQTSIIFYASLVTCVSNITLNYIFIHGQLGLPAMGLLGAGWGTLTARVLTMLLLSTYVFGRSGMRRHVSSFFQHPFSLTYIKKLFKLGLPIGLQLSLELAVVACYVLMMGWISVEAQAADAIMENIIAFGLTVTWAFSSAASILVSGQIGKGNVAAVRSAGMTSFVVAGSVSLAISLVIFASRNYILPLYGPAPEVLVIAEYLLCLAALWNLFDTFYTIGMGVLRGLEDTFFPFWVTTLIHWSVGMSVSYFLAFQAGWGPAGIVWGSICSYALAGLVVVWRFYVKSRQLAQSQ